MTDTLFFLLHWAYEVRWCCPACGNLIPLEPHDGPRPWVCDSWVPSEWR